MSSEKADVSKTFDVLDPRIQCLTPLSDNDEDHCLVTGAVPAGVVVLLHSHTDLGGEVQGLWQDRWSMLGVSDVFDVPGGLKYAWRNASGVSAALLLVCLMRLGRFLRDAVAPGAPQPADVQRFVETYLRLLARQYHGQCTAGISVG